MFNLTCLHESLEITMKGNWVQCTACRRTWIAHEWDSDKQELVPAKLVNEKDPDPIRTRKPIYPIREDLTILCYECDARAYHPCKAKCPRRPLCVRNVT